MLYPCSSYFDFDINSSAKKNSLHKMCGKERHLSSKEFQFKKRTENCFYIVFQDTKLHWRMELINFCNGASECVCVFVIRSKFFPDCDVDTRQKKRLRTKYFILDLHFYRQNCLHCVLFNASLWLQRTYINVLQSYW